MARRIHKLSLTYYFIALGPTATVQATAEGNEHGDIEQIGYSSQVSSYFSVAGTGIFVQTTNDYSAESSSYSIDYKSAPITLNIDQEYTVEEGVNVNAIAGAGVATGYAYVDPMISVPSGYTVETSAGVGNSLAPVPEPSAWATTLAGFAGLGYVRYRTRRKTGEHAT
jgi:hypothetical protein